MVTTEGFGSGRCDNLLGWRDRFRRHLLRKGSSMPFAQMFHDLFDNRGARARKKKKIFRALSCGWKNKQILGEELRFARGHRSRKIDRLDKTPARFARDERQLS